MRNKILTLGFVVTALIVSCKKDEIKKNKQEVCNCGLVVSDNVDDYSVVIRNSCSGNEKRFYLQPGDWMNAHPGSDYCITNVTNW
jgi:hypothetical protein